MKIFKNKTMNSRLKKLLTTITLGLLCAHLGAQELLPIEKSVKKGVLANDLTYYIKHTEVVKDAASFYLVQNVGSVLENDNQQGLAHFLEHLAFNGSKNFPGKGIVEVLRKEGLNFNAYTGYDDTSYYISNVPNTPERIDLGLLILHDWCNSLLLTEEEIDKERGVVREEWRTRNVLRYRLSRMSDSVRYNNAKYANRSPIGIMDVVNNFEPKVLRNFYHDWYRTDLQAIAVIGDINVADIVRKVKSLFSTFPAVTNPKERFYFFLTGST